MNAVAPIVAHLIGWSDGTVSVEPESIAERHILQHPEARQRILLTVFPGEKRADVAVMVERKS